MVLPTICDAQRNKPGHCSGQFQTLRVLSKKHTCRQHFNQFNEVKDNSIKYFPHWPVVFESIVIKSLVIHCHFRGEGTLYANVNISLHPKQYQILKDFFPGLRGCMTSIPTAKVVSPPRVLIQYRVRESSINSTKNNYYCLCPWGWGRITSLCNLPLLHQ